MEEFLNSHTFTVFVIIVGMAILNWSSCKK